MGWIILRGPSIKDARTKSRKITPSPLAQTPPPLSVRTHRKIRKILSFFAPKSADVRFWRTPSSPLSALANPPECERLLWQPLRVKKSQNPNGFVPDCERLPRTAAKHFSQLHTFKTLMCSMEDATCVHP